MRSGSASVFVGSGRRLAVAAVIASLAVVASSLGAGSASASTGTSSASHSATTRSASGISGLTSPGLSGKHFSAGVYIVQLKSKPVSTYTGGVSGYSATRPAKGHQLNAHSSASVAYSKHLTSLQSSLTSKYDVKALSKYTIAYNGFGAKLSESQANELAKDPNVISMTKDRLLKVQDDPDTLTSDGSLTYLNVQGSTGLWNSIGGHANAGKGIVLGDIDTGISPENPAFTGDPLETGTTADPPADAATEPWLNTDTNKVTFTEANGNTFTSSEVTGEDWDSSDYNTKLIGGQYFDAGFLDGGDTTPAAPAEYASPRDGDGHGSHTASTAVGNFGNEANIDGTDYGTISGVAPAAKVAMYKACWTAVEDADTGCSEVDLLAAINQAVTDGVNVINFSIGGGGADTTYSPTDEAFLNAATAGIFVSAAAGNSGPTASTLDNASPWITTVAASSIPSFAAKVVLGDGKSFTGASITVNGSVNQELDTPDTQVITNAHLVLASSLAVKGQSKIDVNGCNTGALKPITNDDTVVVCDREGIIDRTTKSQTVADAGGIGMVLVNTIPEDIDADAHAVPTVHLDYAARATIRSYAEKSGATVSFLPTTDVSPVPQVAGFSSRGPVEAAGSDILKPDISAPGVSILAAIDSKQVVSGDTTTYVPQYGLDSGTSMATPHIAGFAALYLGEHPMASPASIKSALMTTATDTVDSTDASVTDPFVQGAGEVDPTAYLNPGLVYDSGVADWDAYIDGTGQASLGVAPINPSDLNEPSIAIGALSGTQTVTRTLTDVGTGDSTYTGSITGLTGITAQLSTTSLSFTGAPDSGPADTQTFTVTFSRTTAPIGKYQTGFLTWTDGSTTVRSPIAVEPVAAPPSISGAGTNGSATLPAAYGVKKDTTLHAYGLAATTTIASGALTSDDVTEGIGPAQAVSVSSSTTYARFGTVSQTLGTSVELAVLYRKTFSSDPDDYTTLAGLSDDATGTQSVSINKPKAGSYLVITFPIVLPSGTASVPFAQTATLVKTSSGAGHLAVSPTKTPAAPATVQVRWGALSTGPSYLGVIRYGSTSSYTLVSVNANPATAPQNEVAPKISGKVEVGKTLTGTAGTWNISTRYFDTLTYQWYDNGTPIPGATKSTHKLTADDMVASITLEVTAQSGTLTTTATSNSLAAP